MESKDRSGRREQSPKGSPAFSLKRKLVREGVPEARPKGAFSGKRKDGGAENLRAHKAGISLSPRQRGTRAPSRNKSGGPTRRGK